jgi:hypothetical protein
MFINPNCEQKITAGQVQLRYHLTPVQQHEEVE